jgi:hypothetical protein
MRWQLVDTAPFTIIWFLSVVWLPQCFFWEGVGGHKTPLLVLPSFHAILTGGLDQWIPDY